MAGIPHTHFVEPFFGGGSVMLAKPYEGVSEVANDLNGDLVRFWQILACPVQSPNFIRMAQATPFSEGHWREAEHVLAPGSGADDLHRAVAFFVRCRQSLAGRMKTFAPLSRNRVRRGMNEQASAWLTAVEGLPAVHERLKRVVILNRPAIEAIRQQDGPNTLFYCDPPYTPDSRAAPDVYDHEMTPIDHVELLSVLRECQGKVVLSGYPNPLYDQTLADWRVVDFDCANHAASGAAKRRMTERLWIRGA